MRGTPVAMFANSNQVNQHCREVPGRNNCGTRVSLTGKGCTLHTWHPPTHPWRCTGCGSSVRFSITTSTTSPGSLMDMEVVPGRVPHCSLHAHTGEKHTNVIRACLTCGT
jgi:hypothetical protein